MKLTLIRSIFTENSTIGDLSIDGIFFCYTLEDRDRRLEEVGCSAKVYGETCIPRGVYQIVIDRSLHYKKDMLHILDVPCFEGVRIHTGNKPADTEGCILLGLKEADDYIWESKMSYDAFYDKLLTILSQEKVYLEVV